MLLAKAFARNKIGLPPLSLRIVDVGCSGGFEPVWDVFQEKITLIGFDPNKDECKRLNERRPKFNRNEVFLPTAVSDGPRDLKINITENINASSCLDTNAEFISRFYQGDLGKVHRQEIIKATALDSLDETKNTDFMKVDVEGHELAVLRGAKKRLEESILGLRIEVFFQPYRIGQPTFSEIDEHLKPFGFALFDIQPEYWTRKGLADPKKKHTWYRRGQIMWGQVVYFKDFKQAKLSREQSLKLMLLADAHGHTDYAYEVFENISQQLDERLRSEVQELLIASWEKQYRISFVKKSWMKLLKVTS